MTKKEINKIIRKTKSLRKEWGKVIYLGNMPLANKINKKIITLLDVLKDELGVNRALKLTNPVKKVKKWKK